MVFQQRRNLRVFLIICLLALFVLLGFIRNQYLLLWESKSGFLLIERGNILAQDSYTFVAQLPSLMIYFFLYCLGNTAVISLYTQEKKWWQKVLLIYGVTSILSFLLMLAYFFSCANLFLKITQSIKEILLSPLPSLILLPLVNWQSSQLK